MMTNTTSFRNKLILGGVLLTLMWFLMPLGVAFAGSTADYIDEIVYSYDGEGFLNITFHAKLGFDSCFILWSGCSYNCFVFDQDLVQGSDIGEGSFAGIMTPVEEMSATTTDFCVHFTAGNTYTEIWLPTTVWGAGEVLKDYDLATLKAMAFLYASTTIDELTLLSLQIKVDGSLQTEITGYWFSLPPNITINYPPDGAEITGLFEMEIDFEKATGYDRLMILFEDWHASSTCPISGTSQWEEEYSKWFNYQSLPYFSDFFTTSTGTTTIKVSDLATGIYNCARCYFINETTGAISNELCPTYDINVIVYVPPEDVPTYYLPITPWQEYYTEHSERFATSTPLFTTIAGIFEPLITWIGNTALSFQGYFDPDNAKTKGAEMGNAIPVARGYLESIDDFFGGLPISAIFIFYIITALVIFVYRLVKGVLGIVLMAIPK